MVRVPPLLHGGLGVEREGDSIALPDKELLLTAYGLMGSSLNRSLACVRLPQQNSDPLGCPTPTEYGVPINGWGRQETVGQLGR